MEYPIINTIMENSADLIQNTNHTIRNTTNIIQNISAHNPPKIPEIEKLRSNMLDYTDLQILLKN